MDTPRTNRETILQHLARVEVQIGQGEQHIRRQRDIVEDLEMHGQAASAARSLLSNYEKAQAVHLQERRRCISELAGGVVLSK